MKNQHLNQYLNTTLRSCLAAMLLAMSAGGVFAQVGPRPTVSPSGPRKGYGGEKIADKGDKGDGSEMVRIRRFAGSGTKVIEKTPEFKATGARGLKPQGDWAQIQVAYDTKSEWIDELAFQFYVLTVKNEDGKTAYSLFTTTVKFADIEKGRDHLAAVYLRPNTVKRFGAVVASAVEISYMGKTVAEKSDADPDFKMPDKWWIDPKVVERKDLTTREGYLLDRSLTPFALVNIDDYEVSK